MPSFSLVVVKRSKSRVSRDGIIDSARDQTPPWSFLARSTTTPLYYGPLLIWFFIPSLLIRVEHTLLLTQVPCSEDQKGQTTTFRLPATPEDSRCFFCSLLTVLSCPTMWQISLNLSRNSLWAKSRGNAATQWSIAPINAWKVIMLMNK